MWLLNAKTRKLEYADRQRHTHYAILSHTWGDGEVLFDDIDEPHAKRLVGYKKIDFACRQALDDQLQYVWIDTCCIDKRSSAELSEAINSMYRWYYDAHICYAFIADVQSKPSIVGDANEDRPYANLKSLLTASRWFYRGWTLQELIAPRDVKFYDKTWRPLGDKVSLRSVLSDITKISSGVLKDRDALSSASIAQRMSWAAGRKTSRLEDQAYSLLGLFDVNMPLLYGEGTKAFLRLQEAIIHSHDSEKRDHSILLWSNTTTSLLAASPADFAGGHRVLTCSSPHDDTYELTKAGLRLTLSAKPSCDVASTADTEGHSAASAASTSDLITVVLNCRYYGSSDVRIALRLRRRPRITTLDHFDSTQAATRDRTIQIYDRLPEVTTVTSEQLRSFTTMELTIARKPFVWPKMPRKISISTAFATINSWWHAESPDGATPTNYTNRTGGLFPIDDESHASNVGVLRLAVASDDETVYQQHRVLQITADRSQTPPQISVDSTDIVGKSQPLSHGTGGQDVRSTRSHKFSATFERTAYGPRDEFALSVAARLVYRDDHLIWHLHIVWPRHEIPAQTTRRDIAPAQSSSRPQLSQESFLQIPAPDKSPQRSVERLVPKWASGWRKTYGRILQFPRADWSTRRGSDVRRTNSTALQSNDLTTQLDSDDFVEINMARDGTGAPYQQESEDGPKESVHFLSKQWAIEHGLTVTTLGQAHEEWALPTVRQVPHTERPSGSTHADEYDVTYEAVLCLPGR
ncbi:hypothetical protein LTR95_010268 [Oleoguttula sp. CCFEE 5521]